MDVQLLLAEPGSAAAPAGAEQSGHRAQFWGGHWHLPPVWPCGQRATVHGRSLCGYLPVGLFLQTGWGQGGGGHGACADEQLFLVIAFSFPSL